MDPLGAAHDRRDLVLIVARTVADLARSDTLLADHVGVAIQYRTQDRSR
jgi:magnesium chelatase family protein